MTLINISTQQIITFAQLQQMFPYTSFPSDLSVMSNADLATFNVAPVTYTTAPSSQFYTVTMGPFTANADGSYTTTWVQTPVSLAQAQQIQLSALAAYAQNIAWADVTYNGATIPTNATAGVIMAHVAAGTSTITFKGDNGVFIQVAPSDATAIQALMANQVGLAFTVESQIATQINALTDVTDVANLDIATTWTTVQASVSSAA
jgi:hypothetical protein